MGAKYNEYISEHIANVKKAYFWLKDHAIISFKEAEADFLKQLNIHDLSKYDEEEYKAYDLYFYGTKTEKVKNASEAMSSYISILGLIGKGSNLKDLTKFYDSQYEYNLQSLEI